MPLPTTLTATLGEVYARHELKILAKIAARLGKGLGASDWSLRKLLELEALRSAVRRDLGGLTGEAAEEIEKLLRVAYGSGADDAINALSRAGVSSARTAVVGPNPSLSVLYREALGRVEGAAFRILRSVDDVYREAVQAGAGTMLTGVETRREAVQGVLDRLAEKGVTGFTDARGRAWEMQAYAEMAVGTAAHRASTDGHIEKLAASGHDLVVVSDHSGECPECRPWEGVVLSISGGDSRYKSVSTARSGGLEHPGCRHRYGIWIEGVSKRPEPQGKPEDYEARTKQRALERQVRAAKRAEAVALDPDAKAAAKAKIRATQKKLREHVSENGLKRQPHREGLRPAS